VKFACAGFVTSIDGGNKCAITAPKNEDAPEKLYVRVSI
jgi:hypothetical protein